MKVDRGMSTIPSECRGESASSAIRVSILTGLLQSVRYRLHAHLRLCTLRFGRRKHPYMEEQRFRQAWADGYEGEATDGVQEEVAREVGGRGYGQEDRSVRGHHVCQASLLMLHCEVRQRHVPSAIKKTTDLKRTMLDARKAKEENRRRHTREGDSKPKAERKSRYSFINGTPVFLLMLLLSTSRGYGCGAEIGLYTMWSQCLLSSRMCIIYLHGDSMVGQLAELSVVLAQRHNVFCSALKPIKAMQVKTVRCYVDRVRGFRSFRRYSCYPS